MRIIRYSFFIALAFISGSLFANDNIWEGIAPIPLEATYKDKPVTLSILTAQDQLTEEEWQKFETTFVHFWKAQWKDMDHEKLGIVGDVDAFLKRQFNAAKDTIGSFEDACFLCFTVEEEGKKKPIFGIFSEKQLLTWTEEERLKSQEMFFFRLLVQAENDVMSNLVALTKGVFDNLPQLVRERGCGKFLSLARKTSAPKFNLEPFGFTPLSSEDVPTEDNEWITKTYPKEIYTYYIKDF